MSLKKIALASSVAMLFCTSQAFAGVANGSFEPNLAGWTSFGVSTGTTSASATNGTNSAFRP